MGRRPLPAAVRLRLRPGRRPAGPARPPARGGRGRPGLRHRRAGGPDPGPRGPGAGPGQRPGHGRRRPGPAEVIGRVRAAVAPGGRFVAELGGAGNIGTILAALGAAMTEAGLPAPACPWYFPTPGRYATLLEAGGLRVARMEHFPRPTPLAGGPDGLADWLTMFGGQLTAAVPSARLPGVLARAGEL